MDLIFYNYLNIISILILEIIIFILLSFITKFIEIRRLKVRTYKILNLFNLS